MFITGGVYNSGMTIIFYDIILLISAINDERYLF